MSFEYKLWLRPDLYATMYQDMVRRGHTSVKDTIKANLLDATADPQAIANALELIRLRQGVKDGSNPVLPR